jgi:hypothetical protein
MTTDAILHPPVRISSARAVTRPAVAGVTAGRRFVEGTGDLLLLLGLVFCIPVVILGIGMPIALLLKLVVLIGRSLG